MLTVWKKPEEPAFLNDVSSVPLQQTLRHLQAAFTHFFGKRAKYPHFKSRKRSRKSAEYTTSGFRFRDGKLTPGCGALQGKVPLSVRTASRKSPSRL
jgi:putative transposase